MERLPAVLRKSMTYDRGSDPLMVCKQTTAGQGMACHPELARRLKIDIWLARSARPQGRVAATRTPTVCSRQFFAKGTDLEHHHSDRAERLGPPGEPTPLQTLGWKTPEEAMAEELAAFRSNVALET